MENINDYINVSSDQIDIAIDELNGEINKLKQSILDLRNSEPDSLSRVYKEVDIELKINECDRVIQILMNRKTQISDMHDMYMENFGGLDEIGGRGSRN